ncbi:DUF6075 family protein [Desulfotomaculum sp. 1211_IL3151]|uniref:DUF6075 family protein n=1 Tax=Desulfotomaculum sp. 1211_IL3151 TaxID=3084055 RepID=UPI002FD8C8BF
METIRFASKEHKSFYTQMLLKTRNNDSYHQAFFYAMGICEETRRNIRTLFDFKNGGIEPDGLLAPWQTGGTRRLCRLAFNLWNGWTEEGKEQYSAPYKLFDCGFAPYFFEAIRLRYPEYCRSMELSAPRLSKKAR